MFISDKCLGLIEVLGDFYPQARWQRCVVHFYRNVLTVVPRGKVREVMAMVKKASKKATRLRRASKGKG